MLSLKDGIYCIKNVGRELMLDVRANEPSEGDLIQGVERNGRVSQEVCIAIIHTPNHFNIYLDSGLSKATETTITFSPTFLFLVSLV